MFAGIFFQQLSHRENGTLLFSLCGKGRRNKGLGAALQMSWIIGPVELSYISLCKLWELTHRCTPVSV